MTTLIVRLTPALARRLAAEADRQALSHEELAREALRLFLRAVREKEGA